MSSYGEQNGRQSAVLGRTTPVQSAAPSDPRIRNTPDNSNRPLSESTEVCRNYVWGICNKHGQCKYRHEFSREEMLSIIIFCHNYQNRNGCTLPNCTYLHASKEEETLFRSNGQWPRVLMERHAVMRAAAANSSQANMPPMDNMPPMFITHTVPQPHLMTMAPVPPPVPTIMPPPPPPPPPTESSVVPLEPSVVFTAPPPTHNHLSQPPPPLHTINFNASVPPPNLLKSILNRNLARSITDIGEAGPSKKRKTDDGKAADSMCKTCVQRGLSCNMYQTEIDNINRKMELNKIVYKSKIEEYQTFKTMIRCLLPSESSLAVEQYINEPQPSTSSGVSHQPSTSSAATSVREMLLSYLINTSSERAPSPEPFPTDILSADITSASAILTSTNGFSRFFNGLDGRSASTPQLQPPIPSPVSQRALEASTSRAILPSTPAAPTPSASAPPSFAPYQSGVPPPGYGPPPFQPGVPPPGPSTFGGFAVPPFQTGVPPPPSPSFGSPLYQPGVPPPPPFQPGVPPPPYQPGVPPPPYQPGVPPPPFQPGVPPPPLRAACLPAYVPGPVPATRPPAPPSSAPPASPANGHYTPYVLGGYSHQYYQ